MRMGNFLYGRAIRPYVMPDDERAFGIDHPTVVPHPRSAEGDVPEIDPRDES